MPWIIKSGWKVGQHQANAPTEHFSGYQFFAISPDGRMASTGFGEDGKHFAEMIVQGMNEAAQRYEKGEGG